jgi:hypothetical protein
MSLPTRHAMPARQDTEAGGCPTLAGVCIVRCGDHPDRLGSPLLDVPSFFGPTSATTRQA